MNLHVRVGARVHIHTSDGRSGSGKKQAAAGVAGAGAEGAGHREEVHAAERLPFDPAAGKLEEYLALAEEDDIDLE